MGLTDEYVTIKDISEGTYSQLRSKFLAFAFPVQNVEQIKEIVDEYQKKYYDARHVCYAYSLGVDGTVFRANDNGEPSGTAGKPILGQIRSAGLTDILIVVVRYFGGVKLGTSGLIQAYKEAAHEAIASAELQTRTVDASVRFVFDYPYMNDVMRIVKEESPVMLEQSYSGSNCNMTLSIRMSLFDRLREKLSKVESLVFEEEE